MNKNKHGTCVSCGQYVIVSGRGLCKNKCYRNHSRAGTLDNFPRKTWKNSELMAELDFCRRLGLSVQDAAPRIGVSYSTLQRAIQRAKQRAKEQAWLRPQT